MPQARPLAILLNGPLGIGKSTLGEALGEAIDRSVTLDGDGLAALNPPPADEIASLHEILAILVGHHFALGYDCFVINHYWAKAEAIADLEARLRAVATGISVRCFRLTLPVGENLRRIARRQSVRAIDEAEFEARHFAAESALLSGVEGAELGEPFDVTASPEVLVTRLLERLERLDLPVADTCA
jgi:hypothetical protein